MMRFVPWLLLLLVLATAGAVTLAITSVPAPSSKFPSSGITAADVRPLFTRLGLEPPHTGDLIWPDMLVTLNRIVDRLEALEAQRARCVKNKRVGGNKRWQCT